MKQYDDDTLNEMINACKEVTRQLNYVKSKEKNKLLELKSYRRNELISIRKRATTLGLTETDLANIHQYIHDRND
ncbi:MAG: hypothetical protein ABJA35_04690 [Parafilimonas sp.]|jgi:hypothetical protein